jgi:hypothetical protein
MSDDSDSYQHDDSEEEEEEHEKEEDYDVYAHSVYAPPTMTPRPSFRNPNLVIPDEEDEASAESCGAMDIEARAVLSRAQLDHLANSVENHMRHPVRILNMLLLLYRLALILFCSFFLSILAAFELARCSLSAR